MERGQRNSPLVSSHFHLITSSRAHRPADTLGHRMDSLATAYEDIRSCQCLFLSHDLSCNLHYCRSPYFHCSLRAELLAAETVNANLPVDSRFSVFHGDCFSRTDLSAFSTADTFTRVKLRKRCHDARREEISNFSRNSLTKHMKEDAGLSRYRFIIRNSEAVRVTPD